MSSAACNRKPAHQCLKQRDIFLCDKKSSRHKACQFFFFFFPLSFFKMTALFPGHVDQLYVRKKERKMAETVSVLCIGKAHTSPEYLPTDLSLPVPGKNFTVTLTAGF